MKSQATYEEAHLVVAAIRILEHKASHAPTVEDIASLLGIAREWAGVLVIELEREGIVASVESAFTTRIEIRDHTALEKLQRAADAPTLRDEMEEFTAKQRKEEEQLGKLFGGDAMRKDQAEREGNLTEQLEAFKSRRPKPSDLFKDPPQEDR